LTPLGRALLVERVLRQGWSCGAAAGAARDNPPTARKWVKRYEQEGVQGLLDRSSRPRRSPKAVSLDEKARFEALRRQRWSLWRIAQQCGRSLATLSRSMRVAGLSRLACLEPPAPVVRYERERPGELLHLDIKKLGRIDGVGHRITGDRAKNRKRGIGWDAVHLAIDDHSRVSYALIKADEGGDACAEFLRQAVAHYAGLGVRIERVMTDNGTGYRSKVFRAACIELGLRHVRTKPYTPKTNGKAERFVQTSLREWAYARPYESSAQREAALVRFLHGYNWHRPHTALGRQPPITRIPAVNNLLKLNS
jgi:transposase InsO family protein